MPHLIQYSLYRKRKIKNQPNRNSEKQHDSGITQKGEGEGEQSEEKNCDCFLVWLRFHHCLLTSCRSQAETKRIICNAKATSWVSGFSMGLISRALNTNHDQTALSTEQPLGTELGVKCIYRHGREIDPSSHNSVFRAAARDYQDVNKNHKNLSTPCRALGVSATCKFLHGFENCILCIHFQVLKRSICTTGWKKITPNREEGSLVSTISQVVTSAWDTQTFMHQLQRPLRSSKKSCFPHPSIISDL